MAKLRSLWLGELPLGEAFWTWAIGIKLLVNVTTSALFLALITADRPWAALGASCAPCRCPTMSWPWSGSGARPRISGAPPATPTLLAS